MMEEAHSGCKDHAPGKGQARVVRFPCNLAGEAAYFSQVWSAVPAAWFSTRASTKSRSDNRLR